MRRDCRSLVQPADHDLAQLRALGEVVRALDETDAHYWLFGGWAVDFHASALTRHHTDLDLAVWLEDVPRIAARLAQDGWEHRPDPDEDGGTGFERGDVRLELTYLARDDDGTYTPHGGGRRGRWSDEALGDDVAELGGIRARVVALAPLARSKSKPREDPEEAARDEADAAVLARLLTDRSDVTPS